MNFFLRSGDSLERMDRHSPQNTSPLLGVYGLSYLMRDFDQGERASRGVRPQVLDDLSFELKAGEFIALIGPNGSGKSTLLKLLAGVIAHPAHGSLSGLIQYRGSELRHLSMQKRAQILTYVAPDFCSEFPLTVEEAVSLGRICHGSVLGMDALPLSDRQVVDQALELCQCSSLRSRELRSLSGGERQLVGLARALAQESQILLLDESLSKMDLNHQVLMGKLLVQLVQQGKTIILVSHDLNLASEWASRLWLMKQGQLIFDGAFDQGFTQENLQKLYPKTPLLVTQHPQKKTLKIFFAQEHGHEGV
jgi:iron complex transport system ATP-binding protein